MRRKQPIHLRQQAGFTIVELIVVIVVIAILATIALASYSNVQARARDSSIRAAADATKKALLLWGLDTGKTPKQSGANSGSTGKNPDGTCVGSASGGGFLGSGTYPCTTEDYLIALKYLPPDAYASLPPNNAYGRLSRLIFMLYQCTGSDDSRWAFYYYLEAPNDKDTAAINEINASCRDSSLVVNTYGMRGGQILQF